MSQLDSRNSSATGKRTRTDGGRREDDWTCPSCGNVNFSFRTMCNMRNCTQARPADHNIKSSVRPLQHTSSFTPSGYMGSGASSMYLGASPYAPILSGSSMSSYDLPVSGSSGYHYDYGSRLSMGSPYGTLHMSGPPSYSSPGMIGSGSMYGMAPLLDRYGVGISMGHNTMVPRFGIYPEERLLRKDSERESDWVCPECGNNNFSFRTTCNMRKCNAPRPGIQGTSKSDGSKLSNPKMPEGSWKCEKCGNINYPFRTKCNRQSCGAEKPAGANDSANALSEDDDK